MNIVFFGSGQIAVLCLEALIKNKSKVLCVVTAPDMKKGRNLPISFTPIKDAALSMGLNVYQPNKLSDKDCLDYLNRFEPDIFVVFSYGKILPVKMLEIPRNMPLNIHASLLPKYRGAAPINWAVINGEKKTGITIIKMNEKMDEGDIILKNEINIEDSDSSITLENKLSKLAAKSLIDSLEKIKNEDFILSKQDNSEATYAPKLKKDDGRIDWNKDAVQIINQIRGFLPWPGSYSFFNNKMIKILEAQIFEVSLDKKHSPGNIVSFDKSGILVATKQKALLIKELQPSSGRRITAWQFVQGHKIEKSDCFK